ALGQTLLYSAQRLGPLRLVPLLLAGLAAGAYMGHDYLPTVGQQYSSRDIFSAWNSLRGPSEALMVHGMKARSGAYYAEGEVRTGASIEDVATYLASDERRWAAFSREQLSTIDARFRARSGKHLFVANASNARTVLVSNEEVRGEPDRNPLAAAVRSTLPAEIDQRTNIRFGDKVELVGYDLELPREGSVGPGERLTITWYWRVLERVPGGYQIFVHIDGHGGRINGDHQPVSGAYPTSMWQPGDIIEDRQTLDVPGHLTTGEYTIHIGLWSGPNRMPITVGERDDGNRAIAGRLQIR
ncbi:MAG: hypothetical protein H5U40_09130, partial [Polyangiaceae bacterium]|nr:hypothetical protein [Polyangiaceae bacterium]